MGAYPQVAETVTGPPALSKMGLGHNWAKKKREKEVKIKKRLK